MDFSTEATEASQGCRRYGIPMGIPMGMGDYEMDMGIVINPHGLKGILWGFLNRCEI